MILLTGAARYVGSHTSLALHAAGMQVVGNFSNSSPEVSRSASARSAPTCRTSRVDINDRSSLAAVFARWEIEAVVHFAASKAVAESVARSLAYDANDVGGLIAPPISLAA